jgi:hypothetical protein
MFENNLFSEAVKKTFLVYLLQTNRPIAELLEPTRIDFKKVYENEIIGMIREAISLDRLYETRERLIDEIKGSLSSKEKEFLLSFKLGEPLWEKLGIGDFSHLPGIQWKLLNIRKMTVRKKKESYSRLKKVLDIL